MAEHMLLVKDSVFNAYRDGHRTQHTAVDYGIYPRLIEEGDIFEVRTIRSEPILFKVVEIYRKRLHEITPEEIERAGHPGMQIKTYDPFVYADTKDWYKRVWDYLHPFKNERWEKNPMIVIYVLEKESEC